jgi:copper chaperone
MKTDTLNVSGMTCGGCTGKVTRALSALPGVEKVDVSLPSNTAVVTFDERIVSVETMQAAVRTAGFNVASTPARDAEPTSGGGCCSS